MDTPLLAARGIGVRFGELRAVDGVSFELGAGNLLGLIGPNGAGKTTLLRALAGLQGMTAGSVWVMGTALTPENAEPLQHIGFTPDNPPVYEQLTVRQFLEFVARGYNLGAVEAEERIGFWLEKVWLTEKAGQKIKGLSRGMRQRLGIARTLLANPTVILLDEPAAGLDPAGRAEFRKLLADLRDQGKALVVSSHILSDMAEYCTHIGIMAAGKMHQFGTVEGVIGQVAAGAEGRCRYTVTVVDPPADVVAVVAGIAEVSEVSLARDEVTLTYFSEKGRAVGLLRELQARGLAVAGFRAHAANLEEAYLRTGIRQVD